MSDPVTPPPAPPVAAPQVPAPVAAPAAPSPPAPPAVAAPVSPVNVQVHNAPLPDALVRMLERGANAPAAPVQPALPLGAPEAPKPTDTPGAPAAQAQPVTPAPEAPKPAEDPAAKLHAQLAEQAAQMAALREQYHSTAIRAEVERVCSAANAVAPADVLALVRSELDVTPDGRVIAKGDPRTSGEQVVARFLAARPHMLRPTVPGGGAGSPAVPQAPVAPSPPDLTTKQGLTHLARMGAQRMGFLPPVPTPKPS